MVQLVISLLAFIFAISILVAVHEFGHFWVARQNGIRVLRFSIGFGKPLYRWYDKQGTEFVIAAIPLGGYVSLLGERSQDIPVSEQPLAYSYKSPWVRIAVLLAGPIFNLLFAVIAFWVIYLLGVSVYLPILGSVPNDSPAGRAGLHKGQEIVAIENIPTPSWESVGNILLAHIGEDKTITISVREQTSNALISKKLDLSNSEEGLNQGDILDALGLEPFDPVPPIVQKLIPDHPAEKAGFKPQDKIIAIDNKPISSRMEAINTIQKYPEQTVSVEVLRKDQTIKLQVVPGIKQSEKGPVGFIGVEFPQLKEMPEQLVCTKHYGPFKALFLAVEKTYSYSMLTLKVLKKMIVGQLSARHVSGPITIAKYAGQTAYLGFQQFLNFMALISISLGVLNLLPIPILDGGHILYCVAEIINGKPLSFAVQNAGFWLGGIILLSFMLLAFYNDLLMIVK